MEKKGVFYLCVLCLFLLLQGCAVKENDCVYYPDPMSDDYQLICEVADPLEHIWNRPWFWVNDKLWTYALDPANKVWRKIPWLPERVDNFLHHIAAPVRFAGAVMQGKPETAGLTAGEFIGNTFFGGFGLYDVVPNVYQDYEDVGQGFAHWGMGEGIWIVWPVFGGRTLRDSVGAVVDTTLSPAPYVTAPWQVSYFTTQSLKTWEEHKGTYYKIMKANSDPYKTYKEWYITERRSRQQR